MACAGSLLLHRVFSSCGEQGLLSSCGSQASHCGGFFCCKAQAPGCTGFSSCDSRALEHKFTGSVIVAHRPCCSVECGILLDQGSNLHPPPWQADSLPLP